MQPSLLYRITGTNWTKNFERQHKMLHVGLIPETDISIRIISTWSCIEVGVSVSFINQRPQKRKFTKLIPFFQAFAALQQRFLLFCDKKSRHWINGSRLYIQYNGLISRVEIYNEISIFGTTFFGESVKLCRKFCNSLLKHMGWHIRRTEKNY